jgi:hypothetical protein
MHRHVSFLPPGPRPDGATIQRTPLVDGTPRCGSRSTASQRPRVALKSLDDGCVAAVVRHDVQRQQTVRRNRPPELFRELRADVPRSACTSAFRPGRPSGPPPVLVPPRQRSCRSGECLPCRHG